jgi:multidrug transporter EmrE-like cation transporter
MSGTLFGYLWCAIAALASAGASFLIKFSSGDDGWTPMRLAYLGGACATYALGFVCYTIALQKLPMTLAYPVMTATTIALVTLLGIGVLGETLTTIQMIGLVLISVGVFALAH